VHWLPRVTPLGTRTPDCHDSPHEGLDRLAHGVWLTTLLIWIVDMMLAFATADEGPGFEVSTTGAGEGMQIMRDRIAGLAASS
jgi:hypothetical protein